MPRLRVIILEQEDPRTFRYALWADVPVARQPFYANPTATSAWENALAADLTALQSGQVVERVDKLGIPSGGTLAQARSILQANWQFYQDRITADNPWQRYGSTWDGTTWTVAGVS